MIVAQEFRFYVATNETVSRLRSKILYILRAVILQSFLQIRKRICSALSQHIDGARLNAPRQRMAGRDIGLTAAAAQRKVCLAEAAAHCRAHVLIW